MRTLLQTLVLALAVTFGTGLRAAPATDDFVRGNGLYTEGKFADAAGAYEAQVQRGEYTANLFYNLGDAYYRQGDRGRAILNFQRAILLEPGHAEAAANLAFVHGRGAAMPTFGADGFPLWMDVNAWTIVTSVAAWVVVIGLVAAAVARRWRVVALLAGVGGLIVTGLAGLALYRLDGGNRNPARAVITEEGTRALYSPADNSKAVVVLPAGREVMILVEEGAWAYIELGDTSRGWVLAKQVERIVLREVKPTGS